MNGTRYAVVPLNCHAYTPQLLAKMRHVCSGRILNCALNNAPSSCTVHVITCDNGHCFHWSILHGNSQVMFICHNTLHILPNMRDLHDTGVDRTVVVTCTVGIGSRVAPPVDDGNLAVIWERSMWTPWHHHHWRKEFMLTVCSHRLINVDSHCS